MTLDLTSEVQLDPTIQFSSLTTLNEPQHIFLTGASGFLGAFLLDSLLHQTQAEVHCLIRCPSEAEGWARLKKHLEFYQLWNPALAQRIHVVPGDLSKPLMGIEDSVFDFLADTIDVIYHSAAQVNSFYSYKALKSTNVLGTHELLRLAAKQRSKPVHFMSTLAVFFSPAHFQEEPVKETDVPDVALKGGYKQSKWVSEALLREAQARGLQASVYRTARLMGDTRVGINGNTQDFLCSMLKACVHLQQVPAVDANINMMAVDFAAQAIVKMSLQVENLNRAFHLYNPTPTHWNELYAALEAAEYHFERVPFDTWLERLKQATQAEPRSRTYAPVAFLLRSPTFLFAPKPPMDNAQAQQALAALNLECPVNNEALLKLYMDYFKSDFFN